MRTTATTQMPQAPSGARALIDERGHAADEVCREPAWFARLSHATREFAGSPVFTALLLLAVLVWLVLGPLVGFSKAWELTATAGAPITALVLLVVIQHTQNRDDKAIHLKLNEVIRASEHASDGLIGIEDSPEAELCRLLSDYRRHAGNGRSQPVHQPARSRWRRLGRRERWRHAEQDLGAEHSFVFRSPEGRCNARAQNLTLFAHLAPAVDDATWLHHLHRGDYSRWFRDVIGDEVLAAAAARLEGPQGTPSDDSRQQIIAAIARRYPLPA